MGFKKNAERYLVEQNNGGKMLPTSTSRETIIGSATQKKKKPFSLRL